MLTIILCFLSFGCANNHPPIPSPQPQNASKELIRVWTTLPVEWIQTALAAYLKDNPQVIVNTTPFLVYYDGKEKTVNLPFWDEVIPQNQEYFAYRHRANHK